MMRTMIPVALSVLALAACSSDGDPGGDPGVTPPPTSGETPERLVEGDWALPCRLAADEEDVGSRVTVLQITGQVFQLFEFAYGDTTCLGEGLWLATTTGTFDEQLIEDGRRPEDGIPVDLAIGSVVLEPLQGQVADRFNVEARCGSMEWVSGVDRDVSGCEQVRDSDAPRVDYNRFFVDDGGTPDERADDTLALGTLGTQTDESNRPQGVNREVLFTRRLGTL